MKNKFTRKQPGHIILTVCIQLLYIIAHCKTLWVWYLQRLIFKGRSVFMNNLPEYFGMNVFSDKVMKERLPKDVYEKLLSEGLDAFKVSFKELLSKLKH